MDVDRVERRFLREMQAHHDHPGNPEKDDVKAGDQHVGRVMRLQQRRLFRSAERRERPERRREPGVQHIPRSEEHTSELQSLMRISYAVFCYKNKISRTTNPQR